jgi:hypothetical protein
MAMKRHKRREDDVVEIDLGNGSRAFGRLLVEPLVEFFDRQLSAGEEISIQEIVRLPVAFSD